MEAYTSGEGKNDCKMLFFQHRKSDIILGNSTKEGWKEIKTENIFFNSTERGFAGSA